MLWIILMGTVIFIYAVRSIVEDKNRPPGPFGIPWIGYLPFINAKQPYKTLYNLSKKYGNIYRIKLGGIKTLVISDHVLIRDVLKREDFTGRAPLFVTHGIMGGYGIICAEGGQWSNQRKHMIESLRRLGMVKFGESRNQMERRITDGVAEFVSNVSSQIENANVQINPLHDLFHSLGNVMNDFVFGIKYLKDDPTWKYLQLLQEEGVKYIGVSGPVNFLPFLRHLTNNRKTINFLLEGKGKTHAIYDKIIQKCTNSIETYPECILKSFIIERNRLTVDNDECAKYFSDEQLRHALADMFGAGVDTTLTTIKWFILYTAKYLDVQNKLRNEMTRLPLLEDFDRLPYMRATLSETLRIRPVVPLGIPHGTRQDTQINGYKIDANTMIIPLLWGVHMNEKHWKNPEHFNPSRFLSEEGEFIPSPMLIPFQTGKRMCLGEEMAKMLLFLFCSHFIYNFKYDLVDEDKIDFTGDCGITLCPQDYTLRITKTHSAS